MMIMRSFSTIMMKGGLDMEVTNNVEMTNNTVNPGMSPEAMALLEELVRERSAQKKNTRKTLFIVLAIMWAVIILVGIATAILLIIPNLHLTWG